MERITSTQQRLLPTRSQWTKWTQSRTESKKCSCREHGTHSGQMSFLKLPLTHMS